jgi:hypothetical protein
MMGQGNTKRGEYNRSDKNRKQKVAQVRIDNKDRIRQSIMGQTTGYGLDD